MERDAKHMRRRKVLGTHILLFRLKDSLQSWSNMLYVRCLTDSDAQSLNTEPFRDRQPRRRKCEMKHCKDDLGKDYIVFIAGKSRHHMGPTAASIKRLLL